MNPMRYLPIELDVRDRAALVVGAGPEAASKVERLLAAGAKVTVAATSERMDPLIEEAAQSGRVQCVRRAIDAADLEGKVIIFLEPGDDDLSRRLFEEAAREGRLVCTLDRPELSTFANPAVARVPGMTMSFSSGGVSPSVVRRVREDLEALFSNPRFERFMEALRALRGSLKRGERGARMKEAAEGFSIEARLRFPRWVDEPDEQG